MSEFPQQDSESVGERGAVSERRGENKSQGAVGETVGETVGEFFNQGKVEGLSLCTTLEEISPLSDI